MSDVTGVQRLRNAIEAQGRDGAYTAITCAAMVLRNGLGE